MHGNAFRLIGGSARAPRSISFGLKFFSPPWQRTDISRIWFGKSQNCWLCVERGGNDLRHVGKRVLSASLLPAGKPLRRVADIAAAMRSEESGGPAAKTAQPHQTDHQHSQRARLRSHRERR
jgi:hypothetical protein